VASVSCETKREFYQKLGNILQEVIDTYDTFTTSLGQIIDGYNRIGSALDASAAFQVIRHRIEHFTDSTNINRLNRFCSEIQHKLGSIKTEQRRNNVIAILIAINNVKNRWVEVQNVAFELINAINELLTDVYMSYPNPADTIRVSFNILRNLHDNGQQLRDNLIVAQTEATEVFN